MDFSIFYISDIHLDVLSSKDQEALFADFMCSSKDQEALLVALNRQISPTDLLLVAGDTSDSWNESIKFLNRLKCKVVAVKGNHDYWDKHASPLNEPFGKSVEIENVTLLNNSFYETESLLIVGSTLWTELNARSSDATAQRSFNTLRDHQFIDQWSANAQVQQNLKNVEFFNQFFKAISFFKDSWLSKKFKEKFSLGTFEESWRLFVKENCVPADLHKVPMPLLKTAFNAHNKDIICLTHHAPFIEEALTLKLKNYTEFDLNFLFRTDISQFSENYLNDCERGRIPSVKNFFYYTNYFNRYLDLPENMSVCWIHGHTHRLQHETLCRGQLVCCNPLKNKYFLHADGIEKYNWAKKLDTSENRKKTLRKDIIAECLIAVDLSHDIEQAIDKVQALKALRWLDRKRLTHVSSIVFVNHVDSLLLSITNLVKKIDEVLILANSLIDTNGSLFKNMFGVKLSNINKDLQELIELLNCLKDCGHLLEIAKHNQSFWFIMGGDTSKQHFSRMLKKVKALKKAIEQ